MERPGVTVRRELAILGGCRAKERAAALEADATADQAAERVYDEAPRDAWFDHLRTECSDADRRGGGY